MRTSTADPALVDRQDQAEVIPRKGRPRSRHAHGAVLDAAADLFAARGMAGTSIDAIASRAGVSKATIYRWWSSKEELIVEAVDRMRGELETAPCTDDPRADLVATLRAGLERFASSDGDGRLLPRLLDAAVDNPTLAATWRQRLIQPRRGAIAAILQRGIDRGELRRDFDMELAVDLLVAPPIYRLHVTGTAAPDGLAEQLVDIVWTGLAVTPAHQ